MTTPPFPSFSKRRQQRGAAVFVVVMAILLLTGLGTWAIHSATLATTASGHQRMGTQTLYTAELGVNVGTGYLALPGIAQANYAAASVNNAGVGGVTDESCLSIPAGLPPGSVQLWCKSILMSEVDTTLLNATGFRSLDMANPQGSLSPHPNTSPGALDANFRLELTEPRDAFVAGQQYGGQPGQPPPAKYKRVTLTSYATVRPADPLNANLCVNAGPRNAVASQVGTRARVLIGPI